MPNLLTIACKEVGFVFLNYLSMSCVSVALVTESRVR